MTKNWIKYVQLTTHYTQNSILEMQKPEGEETWGREREYRRDNSTGSSGIIPIRAAEVDRFLFQFLPSITHTIFSLQLSLSFTFWPGRTGSKIGQVCLKWRHDCTAADSHSCSRFSSHSPTGALGIVVLRWVPVLISHAVYLLELKTGRKLLSTASFRAIFLCQMLTLEPKNRGATVLKLRLMKQLI